MSDPIVAECGVDGGGGVVVVVLANRWSERGVRAELSCWQEALLSSSGRHGRDSCGRNEWNAAITERRAGGRGREK